MCCKIYDCLSPPSLDADDNDKEALFNAGGGGGRRYPDILIHLRYVGWAHFGGYKSLIFFFFFFFFFLGGGGGGRNVLFFFVLFCFFGGGGV